MPPIQPIALVILDGFGYRKSITFNAIAQAHTPHLDIWYMHYPHTLLEASGAAVGLLDNYIGNSEVGHQTIGTGRIIEQPGAIIHHAIKNGTLVKNETLNNALNNLHKEGKDLHIIGLLSDAGVHSHQELLYALLDQAIIHNIHHVYIHPIIDGRDVQPKSAEHYLHTLETYIGSKPISIGTMHGRYYAMDRDNNWDRTKQAYDCLVGKADSKFAQWQDAINHYYKEDITDEFIPPTILDATSTIKKGDGIIFFNFRSDRARQLTSLIKENQKKLGLSYIITPFAYDQQNNTLTLFSKENITHSFPEILHAHHKTLFAIAETEKYAHVTYFFNGGRETPYNTETFVLIPSLKMQTYAAAPEMSAHKITHSVIDSLEQKPHDCYLINYANADMVGHSGDLPATILAVEYLDYQLGILYQQIVQKMNGTLIITGDHGNAEEMFDIASNQAKTSHTNNPVPFLVISNALYDSNIQLPLKTLADIAPYILTMMNIPVPHEMSNY